MDQKVITLIISIVAILATLTSSLIGHYFTAKARTSSYKQLLYGKQVDLLIKILHKQSRFKVFATLLMPGGIDYTAQARPDIGECIKDYSILTEEAGAIIPTELWINIKKCGDLMNDIVEKFDQGGKVTEDDMMVYTGIDTKVALMARSFIGADRLSDESIKLFAAQKEFKKLIDLDPAHLEALAREKNKKN